MVLDAMAVFHRLEPRDLAAAYKKFAGGELPSPPEEDYGCACRCRSADLGELTANVDLPRSPRRLAGWAKGVDERAIDAEGRFVWSANNEALINFGKHRGRRLSEIAAGEPDYLEWVVGNSRFDAETRDIARNAIDGEYADAG